MSDKGRRVLGTDGRLPSGWSVAKLGDVVTEAKAGFACGERDADGVIQLRMNNVDTRGNFVWTAFIRVPADQAAVEEYRLLSGDVLFNNTNSTELVGKTALFGGHCEPVVYSNHFTRIRVVEEQLDAAFLSYWLNAQWQRGTFARICNRWIGQSAVKTDKLLALAIPLPPLPEQRRISGLVHEQMAAVERARCAARVQLEAANSIGAAYFRQLLSMAEARRWPRRHLGDVLVDIEAGKCVSCEERPATPDEWGVLKVSAVTWGIFRPGENKVLPADFAVLEDREVRPGDFLISRSNTTELVGAVVHVRQTRPRLMLSDKTLRLVPRRDEILPEFMELVLRSQQCRRFIEGNATGTSSSMKNITQDTIRAIPLPVPSIDDQDRVMKTLAVQLNSSAPISSAVAEQLNTIERLPAAVLRRAFNGGF